MRGPRRIGDILRELDVPFPQMFKDAGLTPNDLATVPTGSARTHDDQRIGQRTQAWSERGIPVDAARVILANKLRRTEALDTVRSWSRSDWRWLLLLGGRGVGKTWAASAWLMRGAQDRARLVTGGEVAFWPRWDERWEEVASLRNLVVDDPEDLSEAANAADCRTRLAWVLAERYRRGLNTVVISNQGGHDFWAWWEGHGEKLRSRARQIGHAREFGGADMRVAFKVS